MADDPRNALIQQALAKLMPQQQNPTAMPGMNPQMVGRPFASLMGRPVLAGQGLQPAGPAQGQTAPMPKSFGQIVSEALKAYLMQPQQQAQTGTVPWTPQKS